MNAGVSCDNHSCDFRVKTAEISKLKQCSGCRVVLYCSPACQKLMWPNHRQICRKMRESVTLSSARKHNEQMERKKPLLFGEAPVSERLEIRSIDAKDADTLQAVAFLGQLDLEHCAQYSVEKFDSVGIKGTLIFDIDEPSGVCESSNHARFTWMEMQQCKLTKCREIQELVKNHKPEQTICITLFKTSSDGQPAIVWPVLRGLHEIAPMSYPALHMLVQQTYREIEEEGGLPSEIYDIVV